MDDIARLIADIVNPVLVLLILAAPWIPKKPGPGSGLRAARFWLTCIAAIALASFIAETGKDMSVWPNHTTFPSGHESFGAAAAACLAWYDLDWLWLVVPILAIFGWSLVVGGYHDPEDIVGALFVGPLSALCAWFVVGSIWQRVSARRSQT